MNQASQFQAQYPLSPKKLTKKLIEKSFLIIFLSILFGFLLGAVFNLISGGSFVAFGVWTLVCFVVLAGGIFALYGWYISAYIRKYYYDCDENFVTIQKGVFTPTEIHVQYGKIQDVYVDQDILDRFMGLYDVHIASATYSSGIAAHIDGVDHATAENLKVLLLNKIKGGNSISAGVTGGPQIPAPRPAPTKVTFAQPISSDQFPIQSKWFISRIFGGLISTAIFATIFCSWIFLPGKNSTTSLAQAFGFNPNGGEIFSFGLVFFALFFGFNMLWLYFWKQNYRFEFLTDYIVLKDGVISREEKHLPYHTIQNVTVSQSFWEKLLGIYSVTIQNAGMVGATPGYNNKFISSNGIQIPGQGQNEAKIISDTLNKIIATTASNMSGL